MNELYGVVRFGGSIGDDDPFIVSQNLPRDRAISEARILRKYLTPGEKSYYGITYKTLPQSQIEKLIRR